MKMKTFQVEDVTYTVPQYSVKEVKVMENESEFWLMLEDGNFSGLGVRFDNIKFNDDDEDLLEYDLFTSEEVENMAALREVTNSMILYILMEAKAKHDDQPAA